MKSIINKLGKHPWMKIVFAVIILVLPLIAKILGETANFAMLFVGLVIIYAMATSGLDILFGYCGQISLGHAAFFAIGAYGSAIICDKTNIHPLITAIAAAIIAAVVGSLVAFCVAKLRFHFLSLATIAFGNIVYQLCNVSPGGITQDARGFFPMKFEFFGHVLTNSEFYYIAIGVLVILLIAKNNLINSRVGRAFMSIRDNVTAANGMGINIVKYKVIAFAVSAFFTGIAGALYAHFFGYIFPGSFAQKTSTLFLAMLMFGGKASLIGPVIGSLLLHGLTESLSNFEGYAALIYGILLLVIVLFMPGGLVKLYNDIKGSINKRKNKEDGHVKA